MAASRVPYITKIDPNYKPVYYSKKQLRTMLRERTLVNFSDYTPSAAEIETLLIGPKTILRAKTDCQALEPLLAKATDRLARQIDLAHYFTNDDQSQLGRIKNTRTHDATRNRGHLSDLVKSSWVPPPAHWRKHARERLSALRSARLIKNGTYSPPCILEALKKLRSQTIAYVLPADKGGATVLINRKDYIKEALHQLGDRKNYLPLSRRSFDKQIRNLDSRAKFLAAGLHNRGLITDAEFTAMKKHKPEGTRIYFLIKIHKKPDPKRGTMPGRPIAAAFKSPLRYLDKYLANIFSYILPLMPGSLIDTTHLISKLPNGTIPPNSIIVTADVNALYPSIPIAAGIEASVVFYEEKLAFLTALFEERDLPPPPPSCFVREILDLILKGSLINFQNNKFYRQINGTAMGISISVYFANCYMYSLTKHVISNPPKGILLFERFIDDIIVIADDPAPEILTNLFQSISNEHITYTVDRPGRTCNFLDLTIELNINNRVETIPFFKPTSTFSFVHSKSDHPAHILASLPISQLTRLRRNTTDADKFPKIADKLARAFLIRDYKPSRLEMQKARISKKTQAHLITRSIRTRSISSLRFIFPYSGDIDMSHIRRNLELLMQQILGGLSPTCQLAARFRRNPVALITSKKVAIINTLTAPYKNPETTTFTVPYLKPRRSGRRHRNRNRIID
ncbi:MAG: hypothetical protein ACK518_04120 [bacterium]|jgi:hypothetical protein